MSVILLLLIVILWMAGQSAAPGRPRNLPAGLVGFFGFYAVLVLVMGLWGRWLARRVHRRDVDAGLRRFHRMMVFARAMVPLGFGLGVFWLGWGWIVERAWASIVAAAMPDVEVRLPSLLVGIFPPMAAWAGLWWSQYPADRALREQGMMLAVDHGMPVHPVPRFGSYFFSNLRTQILLTVVPILLVILLRDIAVTAYGVTRPAERVSDALDTLLTLPALATVYIFAPEVLRRILDTRPLPDSPLRRRLERLCATTGLRYRDILLWDTQGNLGNAAVMGVLPRVRYVLLSDLLIETMTDEQVEAVFAHEVGHVVHRHMAWYLVVILTFVFLGLGPGAVIEAHARRWIADENVLQLVLLVAGMSWFWALFGLLSRRFERQADVYAARTMQREQPASVSGGISELGLSDALTSLPRTVTVPPVLQPPPTGRAAARAARHRGSYVGPYGATIFASALHRVAQVNNIPTHRHEWLHGSIWSRMTFIRTAAADPARTAAFDRAMRRVYVLLMSALLASVLAWVLIDGFEGVIRAD